MPLAFPANATVDTKILFLKQELDLLRSSLANYSPQSVLGVPVDGKGVATTNKLARNLNADYWDGHKWDELAKWPAAGITVEEITNWNTAYGWGNWYHTTLAGYGITDAAPLSHGVTQYTLPMGGNAGKTTWANSMVSQNAGATVLSIGAALNINQYGAYIGANAATANYPIYVSTSINSQQLTKVLRNDGIGANSTASYDIWGANGGEGVSLQSLNSGVPAGGLVQPSSARIYSWGKTNGLRIYVQDNYPLILGTNNSEVMRLQAGVSIGTTTDPGAGSVWASGQFRLWPSTFGGAAIRARLDIIDDIHNVAAAFSSTIGYSNCIFISGYTQNIGCGLDSDSDDVFLFINSVGYNNGTTRRRNTSIGDGKGNTIAAFNAGTGSLTQKFNIISSTGDVAALLTTKGLVLKDGSNNHFYRVQVVSGALTVTDIGTSYP